MSCEYCGRNGCNEQCANEEVLQIATNFFEQKDKNTFVFSDEKQKEFLKKAFPKANWSK